MAGQGVLFRFPEQVLSVLPANPCLKKDIRAVLNQVKPGNIGLICQSEHRRICILFNLQLFWLGSSNFINCRLIQDMDM